MADVETDLERFESRYDDIDVEAILARCERRGPLTTFSRRRCLYQDEKPNVSTCDETVSVTRFAAPVTDADINNLKDSKKNKNTMKNTKWSFNIFESWRHSRQTDTIPELHVMDKPIMAYWLSRFVMEVRNQKGKEYTGKTLYNILCGLLRHIRDCGVNDINFLEENDPVFAELIKVVDSKMKDLLERGIGTETRQADPILEKDEDVLWEKGVFGLKDAQTLQYTVFFYTCKLFGLRGRDEHRNMDCVQFKVGEDTNGRYIRFIGRKCKTYQGGIGQMSLTNKDIKHYCAEAPEFVKRLPAEETVQEGTTVRFDCKVLGFPKPTVTWYKDDDVVDDDSRATLAADEHDMYSIIFHDISKCDTGTYKVRASNLEGSSANSLYITVKAKSRNRNKKKSRTKNRVVIAPLFPAIVEREAEEKRETLAVEQQMDSPLTPLYSNISMKSPVCWPEFLGEWAYRAQAGNIASVDADLGSEGSEEGSEDVFDSDTDSPTDTSTSGACPAIDLPDGPFICVENCEQSSENFERTNVNGEVVFINTANGSCSSMKMPDSKCVYDNSSQLSTARRPQNLSIQELNIRNTIKTANDTLSMKSNTDTILKRDSPSDVMNNNIRVQAASVPPMQLEDKAIYADTTTVSKISVHRSYARGNKDSTCSVAVRSRSASPYRSPHSSDSAGTESMQNLNNERLLNRMSQLNHRVVAASIPWDDQIAEFILLITSCTCIELLLQVPPSAFVVHVFMAMLAKVIFDILLNDT